MSVITAGFFMTAVTLGVSVVLGTAEPSKAKYPVFGVDESNYQGVIDL